jgi:uncharacterized protein YndB with AHSA1/START domain
MSKAYTMIFQVDADAKRPDAVKALTTKAGINGWWTDTAKVPSRVGGTLELTFPGMPMPFDFELVDRGDDRVEWLSKSFPPPWAGTRMTWELSDNPEGPGTRIVLRHSGWTEDNPMVGIVTVGWGQMFANLRRYVESGTPDPFFRNG